jgi:hypothetical protein
LIISLPQKGLAIVSYESINHFSSMDGKVKDANMWREAVRAKHNFEGPVRILLSGTRQAGWS